MCAQVNKRFALVQGLEKTLKSPSNTRWNSAHRLFESMIENKEYLLENSEQIPINAKSLKGENPL